MPEHTPPSMPNSPFSGVGAAEAGADTVPDATTIIAVVASSAPAPRTRDPHLDLRTPDTFTFDSHNSVRAISRAA
ncbi:hypothetical protein GCM10009619_31320 [Williamsia maris]